MPRGKVVFLAGAAGLIGKNFSFALLEKECSVVLADIDISSVENLKAELLKKFNGKRILSVELEINSKTSVLEAIRKSVSCFGKVDALVNTVYPRNKNYGRHFFDVEYSDFCENLSIHLGGDFLLSQQFAKYFSETGEGNIINLSSVYGIVPPRFEIYENTAMTMPVEYAAIKSALIHLTKYMAKYLKGRNIRVNCISPGGIVNSQPESFLEKYKENSLNKGMLDPEDLNGTLLYLLSDQSRFVNGQNIVVDDGFAL